VASPLTFRPTRKTLQTRAKRMRYALLCVEGHWSRKMCSTLSGIKGLGITKVLYEFHYKKERSTVNTCAFSNYLLHSAHAAFVTFAMTPSRTASFAPESETKTAIAICRPFRSVTSPTSLVAAVTPFTVDEVPVL
jgi:hypothetical protein